MHECEQMDNCWRGSVFNFPLLSFEKLPILVLLVFGWADSLLISSDYVFVSSEFLLKKEEQRGMEIEMTLLNSYRSNYHTDATFLHV